jgi:hypothetical protein
MVFGHGAFNPDVDGWKHLPVPGWRVNANQRRSIVSEVSL